MSKKKKRGRKAGGSMLGRIVFGLFSIVFLVVVFAAGTVAGIVYAYSRNLPDINKIADFQPSRSTRIYARDGTQLATLFRQNRIWVPISKVPPLVRNAFVATEDRNFYVHPAVGPRPVSFQRGFHLAQDSRGPAGHGDRALLHQERDPRALSEPDLFRFGCVRHRSRLAHLFRTRRGTPDPGPGRDAGGHARRACKGPRNGRATCSSAWSRATT